MPALASAWAPARGRGQAIVKISTYRSSQEFDSAGGLQSYPNSGVSSQQEANLYLEYGLTDRLTLVGDLYADLPAYQDAFNHFQTVSLGTEQLALRYQLGPSGMPTVWAVQGLVKVPADPANRSPVAGERQIDVEARLLMGHSWAIAGFDPFCDLEGAYRYRFGLPGEVRIDASVGTHMLGRWMLLLDAQAIKGLTSSQIYFAPSSNQVYDPSFDLYKAGGSLVYRIDARWHIQVGFFDYLAGRNTGAGPGYYLASWWGW